ncbi:MAG TPA: ribokinase [Cyclobacteriaceae bacterium]
MGKILVIGSSNVDLITRVERFPAAGETVTGKLFVQAMGGKGANQALAAHRAGGNVSFVTCVGADAYGEAALQYYAVEGLDVSLARRMDDSPTGTAMILVNDEGENVIVVTPGANEKLLPVHIRNISSEISEASMVMLQMEIPLDTVKEACDVAKLHNVPVLLNVAPARKIDESLIRLTDILVVNETEIETICGHRIAEMGEEGVIDMLFAMGASTVILTLGKRGCMVRSATLREHIPAFEVDTVDSTAAGDTFCGALVARLSKGANIVEAATFASAAAAICVTRLGAQPSVPLEKEVVNFWKIRQDNGRVL